MVCAALSAQLVLYADLQGHDTVIVVVMEFCDLGSLLRAVTKKAFKPHGKWSYHTTYVRLSQSLITCDAKIFNVLSTKSSTVDVGCGVSWNWTMHLFQLMQDSADQSVCMTVCAMVPGLWAAFVCCNL